MSRANRSGRARVREAEDLLVGLAMPGTEAHTALLHLRSDLDTTHLPTRSVLRGGLGAVAAQSSMCLRAGRCALTEVRRTERPLHWATGTAHEWQRYLRWLAAILDRVAAVGAVSGAVRGEWDRAGAACVQARGVWGAVAANLAGSDAARGDHPTTTARVPTHRLPADSRPVGTGAGGFDPAVGVPVPAAHPQAPTRGSDPTMSG